MKITEIDPDVLAELNEAQSKSLHRVIAHQGEENLVDVRIDAFNDCVVVEFKHIFIGIESDGYAHS